MSLDVRKIKTKTWRRKLKSKLLSIIGIVLVTITLSSCSILFPEQIVIINGTGETLESVEIQSLNGYKKVIKGLGKNRDINIPSSELPVFLDSYIITWNFNDGTIRKASVDLLKKARDTRKEDRPPKGWKANYEFLLTLTNRNYVKIKIDRSLYTQK